MADLTPKVIAATDVTTYAAGTGKTREITRVVYMLGALGPFAEDVPRDMFTDSELRLRFDAKRRALESHT